MEIDDIAPDTLKIMKAGEVPSVGDAHGEGCFVRFNLGWVMLIAQGRKVIHGTCLYEERSAAEDDGA